MSKPKNEYNVKSNPEPKGSGTFTPVGSKVLIRVEINTQSTTDAGIIYTENNARGPMEALVIAVGEGVKEDIMVGDIVIWDRQAYGEWNGFTIVDEKNIMIVAGRLDEVE